MFYSLCFSIFFFFFFNDTATTEIYTLSLHDALPISRKSAIFRFSLFGDGCRHSSACLELQRSEEHTSELQSLTNLVCRLLLEKKKNKTGTIFNPFVNRHDTRVNQNPNTRRPIARHLS